MRSWLFLPFVPSLLSLLLLSPLAESSSRSLTFATYNIRFDWRGDVSPWAERRGYLADDIARVNADVLAMQEGLHHQLFGEGGLLPILAPYGYASRPQSAGSGDEIVGVGRNDGKEDGEYVAITYKMERVQVVERGAVWLCGKGERKKIGCKHPEAAEVRLMVWAVFEMKKSPERFIVISTHLDYASVASRRDSVSVILREMDSILKKCHDCPVVLLGDLNANPDDASLALLRERGFRDAFDECPQKPSISYTSQVKGEGDDAVFLCYNVTRRIDYIFFTTPPLPPPTPSSPPSLPPSPTVMWLNHTAICYLSSGLFEDHWVNPSDHLMVTASLVLPLSLTLTSPGGTTTNVLLMSGAFRFIILFLVTLSVLLSLFVLHIDLFRDPHLPSDPSTSSSSLPPSSTSSSRSETAIELQNLNQAIEGSSDGGLDSENE